MEIKMNELKYNIEKFRDRKGFWRDLIDNETLIIVTLAAVMIIDSSFRGIIIAAFLTMIGNLKKKKWDND